MDVILIVVCSC